MKQVQIYHIGYLPGYTYEVSLVENVSDEDFELLRTNVIGLDLQETPFGCYKLLEIKSVPTIQGILEQEKIRIKRV